MLSKQNGKSEYMLCFVFYLPSAESICEKMNNSEIKIIVLENKDEGGILLRMEAIIEGKGEVCGICFGSIASKLPK